MEDDIERISSDDRPVFDTDAAPFIGPDDDGEYEGEDQDQDDWQRREYSEPSVGAPVILPRLRFAGACNMETVKDGELYIYSPAIGH